MQTERRVARQIDFPIYPFSIISCIVPWDHLRWQLTVSPPYPNPKLAVVMRPSGPQQLWRATPHPEGGAVLTYVAGLGGALAHPIVRDANTGESFAAAGPLFADDGDYRNHLWRCEDLGGGTVAINALMNWEYKINIYHSDLNGTVGLYKWDGGAPNERWVFGQTR
jgi:hypothetical protein